MHCDGLSFGPIEKYIRLIVGLSFGPIEPKVLDPLKKYFFLIVDFGDFWW